MQFAESWLRSFVDPPLSTEQLADAMTMAGLEVESTRPVAPPFSGVVVGQIVDMAAHPNADKLRVCSVDVGAQAPLQIVCGAPNVAVGMKAPCALVGAKLPASQTAPAFEIKVGKLRGVESFGMLCSARELGLSEDHGGLLALPDTAKVGSEFREFAELDDIVFDVKLTPDKGHALSVFGIAREVAAIANVPLRVEPTSKVAATIDERLEVHLDAPQLCGRFAGRVVHGVDARAPTPAWMKSRLERAGQRSVSALVDISNYVMLELGRPTHVFDLDKLKGALHVRWAREGETLELLNGQIVTLDPSVGVIADDEAVESLAGIMGGERTAVTLETKNIYIEAAFWWPDSIRGRARRFNFSTEAGHRFERGVDWETIPSHLERITQLVLEVCGGAPGPIDDHVGDVPNRLPVSMRVSRASRLLGVPIDAAICGDVFTRLGFAHRIEGEIVHVTPPSFRFDIALEEDLIEEVARIVGFERIPLRPPRAAHRMLRHSESDRSVHDLRERIAARGFQETVNYAFVDPSWESDLAPHHQPIRVLNPIASNLAVMRSSLIGGLIDVARRNINRRVERVRVFEIGRAFHRDAAVLDTADQVVGVAQPMRIAALATGAAFADQWGVPARNVDFFDLKGDLEALIAPSGAPTFVAAEHPALHPERCARVELSGQPLGWIGELHPKWTQKYELPEGAVVFEIDARPLLVRLGAQIHAPSRFPAVRRDFAFVLDRSISASSAEAVLVRAAQHAAPGLVQEITLFDEYRGKGLLSNEKSLAFRMLMQDTQSTLQDDFIDGVQSAVVDAMERELGARLR